MLGWGGAGLTLGDERGKADHCGVSARKPQIPTCQPNMVVLLSRDPSSSGCRSMGGFLDVERWDWR